MKEQYTKKVIIIWGVIAVVLMFGCYYLGYHNGKGSVVQTVGMGMRGGAGGFNRGGMGGAVTGTVLSKDATSITVQGRDGSSKIVLYATSTQFAKSTSGTIDDVSVGAQVVIVGKTNTDGSVTAQSIQIRPEIPKPIPVQ
ncbi:MAG: hypothetical protein WCO65_02425 [bacterium]